MKHPRRSACWLALAALLVSAAPAPAIDGVYEINQACVAVGCFAGDTPGAPIEITFPGRFRLTSSLIIGSGSDGFQVSSGNVEIDLNGFTLFGSNTDHTGVSVLAPGRVRVRDGSIASYHRAVGSTTNDVHLAVHDVVMINQHDCGVRTSGLDNSLRLERVLVADSSGCAVSTTAAATIRDSEFRGSTDAFGLSVGAESDVRNSRIVDHTGNGIELGERSSLVGCTVARSTLVGVVAGRWSLVTDNNITENGSDAASDGGISCGIGCKVARNLVHGTTGSITGTSIAVDAGSDVVGNTVRLHDVGIDATDATSKVSENTLSLINSSFSGSTTSQGDNLCAGVAC